MCDYRLPAWKIKQLKKFHKTLKQKHEAYRVNAVIFLGTGYTPQQVAENFQRLTLPQIHNG